MDVSVIDGSLSLTFDRIESDEYCYSYKNFLVLSDRDRC